MKLSTSIFQTVLLLKWQTSHNFIFLHKRQAQFQLQDFKIIALTVS